jgi:hypothetical protein
MPRIAKTFLFATLIPALGQAEIKLTNPKFDTDISGWTVLGGVDWSQIFNSPASSSDFGGSLAFMTYSDASAEQCVDVPPETSLYDPVYSFEHIDYDWQIVEQYPACDRDYVETLVRIQTWQGPSCSASDSTILADHAAYTFGIYTTGGMVHGSDEMNLLPGTDHLRVLLAAFCTKADSHGVATVFFDNFVLRSERIFADGYQH